MTEERNRNCSCDEDISTIHLTLEDDTELECHVLGFFEVDEDEYIALVPVDEKQVLLYGYEEHDEQFQLINIEDDEEFNIVSEAFEELFTEEDFQLLDER
ncbi:MAG TPA: DUF1292 domain-containing protein [Tepidimicrobium sp.]|nr:DUF1292 domain-containing protein [Tepidimicrobium sp.]